MNNQIPYFLPNQNPYNNFSSNELEHIYHKIERLEKNIRILENKINHLEKNNNLAFKQEDPSDLYMI